MSKYLVTACLACLLVARASSQTNASSPENDLSSAGSFFPKDAPQTGPPSPRSAWKFRSVEYAGMLFGQSGNYGQFQTINGIYRGGWFLGAGLGLDFYRFRSIPLFLSVTKDLTSTKNGFFVTVDAGTNFPWYKRPDGYYDFSFSTSKFVAGPFWATGLGYKIRLPGTGNQAISLFGGYSYKKLHENATNTQTPTRYDYGNNTWSLKIGLIF